MINKDRLIKTTQKLIQIDSQNPPGNEVEIVKFIKNDLEAFGIKPKIYEFKKNRPNIVCKILARKNKTKKSLLISPHLDTVPALARQGVSVGGKNWKFHPLSGKIYQGKIYGRGATDCKCNLGVSLEVLKSIVEQKISLDYNLIFAATADEETGSKFGLIPLLEKNILKPTLALILDADEFDIVIAQKGLIHFKVIILGKKAHGAYPERGINAISLASDLIQKLKHFKFDYKKHYLLKAPTINFGVISGGDKVNMVAGWCELALDIRFLPGMNAGGILREIKDQVSQITKNFKIEIQDIQDSYMLSKDHMLVKKLIEANNKFDVNTKVCGSEGATVITFFQNKDIPAIASGFGTKGCAHADNEYLEIKNLYKGALILEEFIKKL